MQLVSKTLQLVFLFQNGTTSYQVGVEKQDIKPMNVLRYSDRVVLISQLSKSCSCGIKTDTVPVSDLGGGSERGGKKR